MLRPLLLVALGVASGTGLILGYLARGFWLGLIWAALPWAAAWLGYQLARAR